MDDYQRLLSPCHYSLYLFAKWRCITRLLTHAVKFILTISHNSHYVIIVMYLNYRFDHVVAPNEIFGELPFPPGQDPSFLVPSYVCSLLSWLPVLLISQFLCAALRVTEISHIHSVAMALYLGWVLFHFFHLHAFYHINCSTRII